MTGEAPTTYIPEQIGRGFSYQNLPEQFRIARAAVETIDAWDHHTLHSWSLVSHPSVPCAYLYSNGEHIGWLLGYAIDNKGQLLRSDVTLNGKATFDEWQGEIEEWGGRFVVILLCRNAGRLYLDPMGGLSVVYSPSHAMLASSPALVPYSDSTADDLDLILGTKIPQNSVMYPLGQTPRHGVERVLPNHYVDLTSWEQIRYWPQEPLRITPHPADAVTEIAAIVRRQISAVAEHYPLQLALTAGQDSRMLLACAREQLPETQSFTLGLPGEQATVDAQIAGLLARQANLQHRTLPFDPPTEPELREWMFRIGCSTGEYRGWQAVRTRKQLAPDRVELVGLVGEVGRGFYWRTEDSTTGALTDERLVDITRSPKTPAALARMHAWRSSLSFLDALAQLDLFYVEQRLGCWGGVLPYADAGTTAFRFFPLSHRRVIALMMSMPHDYRRSGQLIPDLIQQRWPELLHLPFNERVGSSKLRHRLKNAAEISGNRLAKALKNPSWLARKMAKALRRE